MSAAMFGVHVVICRLSAQCSELCFLAWSVRALKSDEKAQLAAPGEKKRLRFSAIIRGASQGGSPELQVQVQVSCVSNVFMLSSMYVYAGM